MKGKVALLPFSKLYLLYKYPLSDKAVLGKALRGVAGRTLEVVTVGTATVTGGRSGEGVLRPSERVPRIAGYRRMKTRPSV